jgi:hypothetical protein
MWTAMTRRWPRHNVPSTKRHSWAFFQLRHYIAYKAAQAGVLVLPCRPAQHQPYL